MAFIVQIPLSVLLIIVTWQGELNFTIHFWTGEKNCGFCTIRKGSFHSHFAESTNNTVSRPASSGVAQQLNLTQLLSQHNATQRLSTVYLLIATRNKLLLPGYQRCKILSHWFIMRQCDKPLCSALAPGKPSNSHIYYSDWTYWIPRTWSYMTPPTQRSQSGHTLFPLTHI